MENLTGTQDNTHEEEGNMGRKVKVSELRKGMRVALERGGWRYELTVFQAESPEQGGVSSWTVYADNNGSLGELHCYHGSTEFEVLEEAPVPPEPGWGPRCSWATKHSSAGWTTTTSGGSGRTWGLLLLARPARAG